VITEKIPKIFWEIHNGLPREGPGYTKSTRKAYMILRVTRKSTHIGHRLRSGHANNRAGKNVPWRDNCRGNPLIIVGRTDFNKSTTINKTSI
jgi:hypothetical protein